MHEIEKAVQEQPALLASDWSTEISTGVRKTVKGAKQLTFVGMGSSLHCAQWAHQLCQELGRGAVTSRAVNTWNLLTELAALRSKAGPKGNKEVFVIISHRGNRGLTQSLLNSLGSRPHVLVAGKDTPTAQHMTITTSAQETSHAHTKSLIGAMAACSEIVSMVLPTTAGRAIRRDRKTLSAIWAELIARSGDTPLEIPQRLSEARDPGQRWSGAIHLTGGGAFEAIAREIALKIQEIVHLRVLSYNTEEFLHGPIAAVESMDLIIPLPAFRTPANRIVKNLYEKQLEKGIKAANAIGCQTIVPLDGDNLRKSAAKLSLAFQSLVYLAWAQLLCIRLARHWGLNPDMNRREDPRYEEARQLIDC